MTAPTVRLLDLAIDAGAAYRLTRLLTRDALTEQWRAQLVERGLARGGHEHRWGPDIAQTGGPLPYLAHCPWCASIWVAAGVALARRVPWLPWRLIAEALATSAVVGWLSERE